MRGIVAMLAVVVAVAAGGCQRRGPAALTASGTLEATEVAVSTPLGGRVLRVPPEEGARVAAGDTLVVLDTAKLATQREQAEATLANAQAQREGAAGTARQAQARAEQVARTARRLAALVPQGAATQQQLDDARSDARAAADAHAAAAQVVVGFAAREREVRATLRLLDQQRADGIVRAHEPGTVLLRDVEPGETARPAQPLLTMADLRRLWVRVYVPEREMARVRLGAAVPVRVDAFPGRRFDGRVSWIAAKAEFTPKNVQTSEARAELVFAVKIALDNADGALAIGMPAEVEFATPAVEAPAPHAAR
jgi:HlyD family secretion protein